MSTPLSSTPAAPTTLERDLGALSFELGPDGLTIRGLPGGLVCFSVEETLALLTFFRSPGVPRLIGRLWLSEQHSAALAAEDAEDERRQRRHAGLRV